MSIEGQGHFFTIYFPGFVCFMLYLDKISGERLQDHWSSGIYTLFLDCFTLSIVEILWELSEKRGTEMLFIDNFGHDVQQPSP